jgi:hypothetical protein
MTSGAALVLVLLGHHEAIFGPQSSLVLSAPGFATVQAFTKHTEEGAQETTFVLAGGVTLPDLPAVSFALTVPASVQSGTGARGLGLENALIGARYRFDLEPLKRALGRDANFVMAMAGVELPTGTVDYRFFEGPANALSALLYSAEWWMFSATAFIYYRYEGIDAQRFKKGDEVFWGFGLGFTPIDREGALLSFQLGVSDERHFPRQAQGKAVPETGGDELMLSPTIVFTPLKRWQFFAVLSLPTRQSIVNLDDRDQWRLGMGVLFLPFGD